jgi:hypothetical protein
VSGMLRSQRGRLVAFGAAQPLPLGNSRAVLWSGGCNLTGEFRGRIVLHRVQGSIAVSSGAKT